MLASEVLTPWILAWLALASIVLFVHRKVAATCGLVLAFMFQMFILHWLAPALYLLPWYWNLDLDIVLAGLRESTYALAAFTIGTIIAVPLAARFAGSETTDGEVKLVDGFLLTMYLGFGIAFYGVLAPLLGRIPTVSAIVTSGGNCVVLALGLGCWNGTFDQRQRRTFWLCLAGTVALPVVTILNQGFLGFGAGAAAIVFFFVASFQRARLRVCAIGLIALYLGLSLYVTYMRDRRDIREVVWGGEATSARLSRIVKTFSETELLDFQNVAQLRRIDERLNQTYLVGASVVYLSERHEPFAGGATIWNAALALFPRILWPDKPIVGGSGDLVSRYTGFRFAEGTAVGIGMVMELYVNFGTAGVFLGFIVIGTVIGFVDRKAAICRARGDWAGLTQWFLPGLSLFGLGASLAEVTTGTASAFIVAYMINRVTARHFARVARSRTAAHPETEQVAIAPPRVARQHPRVAIRTELK